MTLLTAPLTTTFELQRTALDHSHRTLGTLLDFQTNLNETLLEGIEKQETVQRRILALHHVGLHRVFNGVEEELPGPSVPPDEFRSVLDDQFRQLYSNHEDVFEGLLEELERNVEAYDEVSVDYLDSLEEQIDLVVATHEDLEAQSVGAAEEFDERIDTLQEQLLEVRARLEPAAP